MTPPLVTIPTDDVISFHVQPERITVAKRALGKVENLFKEAGATIETRIIYHKEPDDYIKEQVNEEGIDLVILGCQGEHSTVKRLIGTVPEKVLNHVPCDVLIAR